MKVRPSKSANTVHGNRVPIKFDGVAEAEHGESVKGTVERPNAGKSKAHEGIMELTLTRDV